jgi:hypothetical protein
MATVCVDPADGGWRDAGLGGDLLACPALAAQPFNLHDYRLGRRTVHRPRLVRSENAWWILRSWFRADRDRCVLSYLYRATLWQIIYLGNAMAPHGLTSLYGTVQTGFGDRC